MAIPVALYGPLWPPVAPYGPRWPPGELPLVTRQSIAIAGPSEPAPTHLLRRSSRILQRPDSLLRCGFIAFICASSPSSLGYCGSCGSFQSPFGLLIDFVSVSRFLLLFLQRIFSIFSLTEKKKEEEEEEEEEE